MVTRFERALSIRNKPIIYYNCYTFNFRDTINNGTTERYRCKARYCPAVLEIENDNIIREIPHCDHPDDSRVIRRRRNMNQIREIARQTNETGADIIRRVIGDPETNRDLVRDMPMLETMRDQISRDRNEIIGYTPVETQDILEFLQLDRNGRNFLRFDSGPNDPKRFVIFIHEFKKKLFTSEEEFFFVDGTFRAVPSPFYQCLIVYSTLLGKTMPYSYILMRSKLEEDYVRVLEKIQSITGIWINKVILDFEKGLSNAFSTVFSSEVGYCFFHFSQAIIRKLRILGFSTLYTTNNEFNQKIRRILLLAFFPENEVYEIYSTLKEEILRINEEENILLFFSYMERMYIGSNMDEENELRPIFPISVWSVYKRQLNGLPRTNNGAESWNRTLNANINNAHPNIAQFITKLLDLEEDDTFKIEQLETGRFRFRLIEADKE